MPILENKLVIKSIEALHDEALALMPNADSFRGVTATPAVLHASTSPRESRINLPKGTSTDLPPETTGEHDIMARIDHLLRKLDEDENVAIAPPEKEPQSNTEDKTGDAIGSTTDGNSDDMFNDGQKGEKPPPNQTQALADIAEAIYQAQKQAVDTVAAEASQNSSTPLDVNVLSATVADEVRRTVSAVIIAELPNLVRDTVGEAIRELRTNLIDKSTLVADIPSAAKSVAARKTTANRKAGGKKARAKKTVAKKASKKATPKEIKPKKVAAKTTAKTTQST
jgi:hypothetical protein